ncbi:MAG: carboxylase [Acidobacteriota bacterium]|jgi:pyruvate/oxaloacetate carboxyltransferase|nr:carboxylase [Acidobacteriota bacterium]
MSKQLHIRDVTLRDGQQSRFATRMTGAQIQRVLPIFRDAGFYALEVWGGAVPDAAMRFLGEDPWERLETIRAAVGKDVRLTALSRGRNLFGYSPYPEAPIEGFCRQSVQGGINIMRIFDALNDTANMESTVRYVRENGGLADCAVCYTVDPRWSLRDRLGFVMKGRRQPRRVFTEDYFAAKARTLEAMGADIVTIKDMAGLIDPVTAYRLIRRLKAELSVPVNLHTHCTPGYGLASVAAAVAAGVDIVDTAVWSFAGGPAAPAVELVLLLAERMGVETTVNRSMLADLDKELREIRRELAQFDGGDIPPAFPDPTGAALPAGITNLLDQAAAAALKGDFSRLLKTTRELERVSGFPAPDEAVRRAQIPGGMYSNMSAQLESLKLGHLFDRVLQRVPRVRWDAGCVPLVTPTSQIVGVQAVNCLINESRGESAYARTSSQFVNLVKGGYGRTPVPIQAEFRRLICGFPEERPFRPEEYSPPENPLLTELGGLRLADSEKERLLLELFPTVARDFLYQRREKEFAAGRRGVQPPAQDPPDIWERLAEYAG